MIDVLKEIYSVVFYVWGLVFDVTFNNISVKLWQLVLLVIGTDCIGSCKSNYYTIMTTTAPDVF
jgi:hypothetical protein